MVGAHVGAKQPLRDLPASPAQVCRSKRDLQLSPALTLGGASGGRLGWTGGSRASRAGSSGASAVERGSALGPSRPAPVEPPDRETDPAPTSPLSGQSIPPVLRRDFGEMF